MLYGLQIASSNLAKGANFAQDNSATVAGSYESFEQDYELDEEDCDMKVEEGEAGKTASRADGGALSGGARTRKAAEERRLRKDAVSQRVMLRIAPQSDWLKFPREPKAVVA